MIAKKIKVEKIVATVCFLKIFLQNKLRMHNKINYTLITQRMILPFQHQVTHKAFDTQ